MTYKHFLGEFDSLEEVWQRYPSGGQEGDYLNVDGQILRWNSIENQWTMPDVIVPPSARNTESVLGDLNVENNLSIGGILRARVVRGRSASCGLFVDEAALLRNIPKPLVGQWALVMIENRTDEDGNAIGRVYVCETDGQWQDAGYNGGFDGEYDALLTEREERKEGDAALNEAVETEAQAREAGDASLNEAVETEAQAREAGDASLQNQINSIQIHGMAVSNEFGDDPNIGISQKKLTESRNDLQRQIDESVKPVVDPVPTRNSPNSVASGGVFDALQAQDAITASFSGDGKIYYDFKAGDIFYVEQDGVHKYRVAYFDGTADEDHPVTIDGLRFYFANNAPDALWRSIRIKNVSTEQQQLTNTQKSTARENIAAVAYEKQELTSAQQVQLQNNMMGKEYAPADFSGLGKKVFAKNVQAVGGVDKNIMTQAFFEDAQGNPLTNTVFVIQYDYELGEDITIPANCVLKFEGGSIKNGTLIGTNTYIISDTLTTLPLTNVTLNGTWKRLADVVNEAIEGVTGGSSKTLTTLDQQISDETLRAQTAEADRYTKAETYSKNEVNSIASAFTSQKYVTAEATVSTTTSNLKNLIDTAAGVSGKEQLDTIYRVGNWDGTQYDITAYSEYAWNGTDYIHISTKPQIGEVFDISAYHATGGEPATYADLAAALDSNNGGGVPQSLQKDGMSVKFIQGSAQSSDNKYMQARCMAESFTTDVTQWQGVDDEPTSDSKNLITSDAVYKNLEETGFVYNIQTTTFDKNYLIAVYSIPLQNDNGQTNIERQIEDYPCYNVSGYSDDSYYINVILEITNQKADILYDDKKLRFFSDETIIDESDPSDPDYDFAGFTQCIIYKDKLYIFYRRTYGHVSEPGIDQYYWYYKVSSDKGKTWSERKSISIEAYRGGDWDGYRDNRGGYVTVYGDHIIMLGVIAPSTSEEIKPYRAYYCLLSEIDAEGTLTISNWHLMPDISFGNSGQDATVLNTILSDTEREFSNVVAGRICIVDNILYWCVYGSADDNGYMDCALCKWPININSYPTSNSVEVLHKFDGKQDHRGYCESSVIYSRNKLAISVIDVILAYGHDCNLNYLYDIESENIEYICTTEQRYAGVETFPIDNDIILQTGRASRYDYINRCDFIGLFTGGNMRIKEYIPLIGKESYNIEGMYCGICADGDTIFISYYYIKSDNKHIIAFKTINKRDIMYLLNN